MEKITKYIFSINDSRIVRTRKYIRLTQNILFLTKVILYNFKIGSVARIILHKYFSYGYALLIV